MNPQCRKWIARVLTRMVPEPNSECVRWVGCIDKLTKYGKTRVSPHFDGLVSGLKRPGYTTAHRLSYALVRGLIPAGYDIDHQCENRWCVNPYHLEAMPAQENAWLANRRRWHGDRKPQPVETPVVDLDAGEPAAF